MACAVTAFSVKIASPGETSIKSVIARECIYEWNALHSWTEKKALLPLQVCDSAEADSDIEADLLVVFFSTSQGTPSDLSARETDLQIEEQVKAGRPALIYFSEARINLSKADTQDLRLLGQFKKRYPAEAIVDSFKDEKEFRAKFAQQLDSTLRQHPHFQAAAGTTPAVPACALPETHPPAPIYSKAAQSLLMSACDDPEAYIARMKDSRGLKIQVNGRQVVEPGNAESAAMWENAFTELFKAGLIRDAGCNGQLFQISNSGFDFLATLGKFPIGYIAELGGM
jgi:hypothetical protein